MAGDILGSTSRMVIPYLRYGNTRRIAGLYPENDPIPSSALSYYAIQKGVCKKEDLTDGYRLSDIAYTITLVMGKMEGLNFGRQ